MVVIVLAIISLILTGSRQQITIPISPADGADHHAVFDRRQRKSNGVTIPIELAMGNVPRVETIRSPPSLACRLCSSVSRKASTATGRVARAEKLGSIGCPTPRSPTLASTTYGESSATLQTTEGHR